MVDLVNFFYLFTTVILVYAPLAYIILGSYVDKLSTLGDCIHLFSLIALGEFSDLMQPAQLAVLDPMTKLSLYLLFWTYAMLMFLVMLSALLAIVCNAMDAVKEELAERDPGHEPKSVVREMWELAMHTIQDSRRRWRGKQIEEERARFLSSWARSLVSVASTHASCMLGSAGHHYALQVWDDWKPD
jgi:hypothetical protein